MQPWAGLGEIITPASLLDHHALGYAYDTEPECAGPLKFKFVDDLPTLKFRDDHPTLKIWDDPQTLKFADDPQTFKFAEDPQTFKFVDDGGPGTIKAIDDVKQPMLDGPGGKFLTDPIDPGRDTGPL